MSKLKHAAVAATSLLLAGTAIADSPFGIWTRPSTGTKVNFYGCGDKLCAKVVSSKNKDSVGKVIMSGATKSGANTWSGDLLNTEDGKTYSGVVTLLGPGALELKGCALAGLICKGETWKK